jgi:hypothetical protein
MYFEKFYLYEKTYKNDELNGKSTLSYDRTFRDCSSARTRQRAPDPH